MKIYLAAYNAVAFLFWLFFFALYLGGGLSMSMGCLLLLNIAQGMAVLEIFHAVFKWVKSPVGSTVAQVASRLLVLVAINLFMGYQWQQPTFTCGVMIVSIAWSVTELIRYAFYFLSLYGKQPVALLWMRYSFFIVLYPLGVTGEWLILLTPLLFTGLVPNAYNTLLAVLFVLYLYYFPVLYKYMWKQRKAKLV